MLNVSMWAKAVNVIPRVTHEEWDGLDVVSRWLIATRSAVLVMTFNSAAIAGLLAARDGAFDWLLWLLVTVGLLVAHATNNLVNDISESKASYMGAIVAAAGGEPINWVGNGTGPKSLSNEKIKAAGFAFGDPDASRDGESFL